MATQDTIDALKAQMQKLKDSEAAREARDAAQDQVTAAQIAALNQTIADLQAATGSGDVTALTTAITDAIADMGAVVTSLDAADPTPPVIVP